MLGPGLVFGFETKFTLQGCNGVSVGLGFRASLCCATHQIGRTVWMSQSKLRRQGRQRFPCPPPTQQRRLLSTGGLTSDANRLRRIDPVVLGSGGNDLGHRDSLQATARSLTLLLVLRCRQCQRAFDKCRRTQCPIASYCFERIIRFAQARLAFKSSILGSRGMIGALAAIV